MCLIIPKLDNFDPSVIPTPFQRRNSEDWFSTRNGKWLKVYSEDFFSLGNIEAVFTKRNSPNFLYAEKFFDPLYYWVRVGHVHLIEDFEAENFLGLQKVSIFYEPLINLYL